MNIKNRQQWVCWREEKSGTDENGKPKYTKVPYIIGTKYKAASNDPTTWGSYEEAVEVAENYSGIGYVTTLEDGMVFIDLDHCIVDGKVLPWALEILNNTKSYAEYSPSGKGIHILVEGPFPRDIRKKVGDLEVYQETRYLTYTGNIIDGRDEILEDQEILKTLVVLLKKPFLKSDLPDVIPPGTRNDVFLDLVRKLRNAGLNEDEILAALQKVNVERCFPPHDVDHLRQLAQWGGKLSVSDGGLNGNTPYTDSGNAELFISQHGKNVRYVFKWGIWIIWDGSRWKVDTVNKIRDLARASMRTWFNGLGALDEEKRKARYTHAMRSESKVKIDFLLFEARGMAAILPEDLDKDIWLINAKNGTINLKTGEVREARREDYITKQMSVEYDPKATCPLWMKCLSQWFEKNYDLISYLQKLQGYCLTGSVKEQIVPIGYGDGANGKDSYTHPIMEIMGDYAETLPISTLMTQSYNAASNDLAKICGARMVTASEGEDGQQLAEAKLKLMTGGGKISARFLYKELFTYTPQFKLWMHTNNKPRIVGEDHAIWRRIRLIPFTRTFSEKEQDKELGGKLKLEASGILNWILDGCREWLKHGLDMPEVVRKAVEEYKTEMDIIQEFLDECCVVRASASVTSVGLYDSYVKFCEKYKYSIKNRNRFGRSMTKKGFKKGKVNNSRCYIGITIDFA